MTWHVDPDAVARYTGGTTDAVLAASIEAHVMACDGCRHAIGAAVDDAVLSSVWCAIDDVLDTPPVGWVERALRAVGCTDVTSRIVAATTRARWAYLFVVACNVLVAFAASRSGDADAAFLVFLLTAPLGPLVATAGAFGRWTDPCHAVLRTVPIATFRLILVRTVAGVVPALVLTAATVPWLSDHGWMAVAWLLPALALALLALALSTWIEVEMAALVVGVAWIAMPIAIRVPVEEMVEVLAGPVQVVSAVVAAVAALIALVRQSKFEYREM